MLNSYSQKLVGQISQKKNLENVLMNIIHVSSEANPFVKTGGLADVVFSLSKELVGLKNNVAIFIPYYQNISANARVKLVEVLSFSQKMDWRNSETKIYKTVYEGIDFYLVSNDHYFSRQSIYGENDDNERFAYFVRATISSISMLKLDPDIIHCHDWQAGMLPLFIKEKWVCKKKPKVILSIHNMSFLGYLERDALPNLYNLPESYFDDGFVRFNRRVSTLKTGIVYADEIITVSKHHRDELLTNEGSNGLSYILELRKDDFVGISNGVDIEEYNPETDQFISENSGKTKGFAWKNKNKKDLLHLFELNSFDGPVFAIVSCPNEADTLLGVASSGAISSTLNSLLSSVKILTSRPIAWNSFTSTLKPSGTPGSAIGSPLTILS